MNAVLFTAHSDDECLFAAFAILRYRPHVVICHPSVPDYGSTETRTEESRDAASVLGAQSVTQWDGQDLAAKMREYDARESPALVFAPHAQSSHPDHVAVAIAAREVFGSRLRAFHTYDANGKVRSEWPIEFEPEWVHAKLRALARFQSQATHPRAHQFFMWDKFEYWGDVPMRTFRLYPQERHWWSFQDYGAVVDVTKRLRPKTVLEFGPGSSTLALLEGGAAHVDCLEDDPKWLALNAQLMSAFRDSVAMYAYAWSDPLQIPEIDAKEYDLALIDGPRTTENRVAVLEYCLQRCTSVLLPLEESADRYGEGYLRPRVLALAQRCHRKVELLDTGPLAGTFALLT